MKGFEGFEGIALLIFLEASYQRGLQKFGFSDNAIYREVFLESITKGLISGYLDNIEDQVAERILSEGERDALNKEIERLLKAPLPKSKTKTKPNAKPQGNNQTQTQKVLKDETKGAVGLPPNSLFSSEDYIN